MYAVVYGLHCRETPQNSRLMRLSSFWTLLFTLKSIVFASPKSIMRPPRRSGWTLLTTFRVVYSLLIFAVSMDFFRRSMVALSSASAAGACADERVRSQSRCSGAHVACMRACARNGNAIDAVSD